MKIFPKMVKKRLTLMETSQPSKNRHCYCPQVKIFIKVCKDILPDVAVFRCPGGPGSGLAKQQWPFSLLLLGVIAIAISKYYV